MPSLSRNNLDKTRRPCEMIIDAGCLDGRGFDWRAGLIQPRKLDFPAEPQPIALLALDVAPPEPARAHHVGNPKRIRLVGLVAHRRKRGTHTPGFQADRQQTTLL